MWMKSMKTEEIKVRIQLFGGICCIIAAALTIIYGNFAVHTVISPETAFALKLFGVGLFAVGAAGIYFFVNGDSKGVKPPTSEGQKSEPTVMMLLGASGTGKTTLLGKFNDQDPDAFCIFTPTGDNEALRVTQDDWEKHAAIAVDELFMWDRTSLPAVISDLESEAISRDKKLLLVTQSMEDLSLLGIHLQSSPLVMTLHGRQEELQISYDGKKISFKQPPK